MIYYILANPNAGYGHGKKVTRQVIRYMTKQLITSHLYMTEKAGDESRLLSEILKQIKPQDRLLIIGGDGTISLSLNAIPASQRFSYIPAGSGNDFARGLNLPRHQPIQSFKNLHTGKEKTIHVLKYTSPELTGIAINNLGIGLDAAIVASANHSPNKKFLNTLKLGQFTYLASALKAIQSQQAFHITINNQIFNHAYLVTFTNHPFFGGGIPLAPQADIGNSDIHLVTLDKVALGTILKLIPKVYKGKHFSSPNVHQLINQSFDIEIQTDQPLQIDGESYQLKSQVSLNLTTEKRTIII